MQSDAENISVAPESLKRRHEAQNQRAGPIALAAASVLAMVFVCVLIVWVMLSWWTKERPLDPRVRDRGTIIAPNNELLSRFPKPNLQTSPHDDLVAFRAREDVELNSYGWINRTSGVVRIPIDRAMDLIASRGLPVRSSNGPVQVGKSEFELARERPSEK
jgi:hypothetical protein